MTIRLVTATTLPHPDSESALLIDALAARGAVATMAAWDSAADDPADDPADDWRSAGSIILRSPWNYADHIDAFCVWGRAVSALAPFWNPWPLIEWNCHKGYLAKLGAAGVAIPPTRVVPAGDDLALTAGDAGADGRIVVKPAIGAGARGAVRGLPGDPVFAARTDHDRIVQPFMPEIAAGETSLIYFGGVFSHAVTKRPAAADWRVQPQYGGSLQPCVPAADIIALADAALAAAPHATLYARVDIVRMAGRPVLMELELIEPELFLHECAAAAGQLADALLARL
jgi:glutathione synthase/RimK-type ligase-like ATP-grasp enzyme